MFKMGEGEKKGGGDSKRIVNVEKGWLMLKTGGRCP